MNKINIIPSKKNNPSRNLQQNLRAGWRTGRRYSKINNKNLVSDMYISSKSAVRSAKFNRNDIPVAAALVGAVLPIPFASVAFFGVGLLVKKILNVVAKKA